MLASRRKERRKGEGAAVPSSCNQIWVEQSLLSPTITTTQPRGHPQPLFSVQFATMHRGSPSRICTFLGSIHLSINPEAPWRTSDDQQLSGNYNDIEEGSMGEKQKQWGSLPLSQTLRQPLSGLGSPILELPTPSGESHGHPSTAQGSGD